MDEEEVVIEAGEESINLLENTKEFLEGDKPSKAVLIGVYESTAEKQACIDHLDELERLADTLGMETLEKVPCPLRKFDASTYLGKGKVAELALLLKSLGAEVVIIDDEISPSQQRNLEKNFQIPVIDRTEVILDVFALRARTREAKLQIELAQVRYQLPRLKRLWTHLSRQRGGGVYSKGEGEKQLEIDKRLLRRRLERLQVELNKVTEHREVQRLARKRSSIPTFAIIGYTNVGKSTLLRALTQADVLVEDKLFATLDTTTRKFSLPDGQEILLIDTVGFIRKIPHALVAAFRSTLEEAVQTDILLHLVDVSHPLVEEQVEATHEVLKALKASDKPVIMVLNKVDACPDLAIVNRLRLKYSKTVVISALTGEGFEQLLEAMTREIGRRVRRCSLRIPQSEYGVVSELTRLGIVQNQEYEENDVLLQVDLPEILAEKYRSYYVEE